MLSALAVKRLQKELRENDLSEGLSLSPCGDDLSKWHANILISDGAYAGVNFHALIEVPGKKKRGKKKKKSYSGIFISVPHSRVSEQGSEPLFQISYQIREWCLSTC